MNRHCLRNVKWVTCTACIFFFAGSTEICAAEAAIQPTMETTILTWSPLPGNEIAARKCGICHSVDYVGLQPPQMSLTQWTAEMVKMQHAYGAPINDEEIRLLGIYLASAYGDATTELTGGMRPSTSSTGTPESLSAQSASAALTGTNTNVEFDVLTVLNRNACLSCHTRQQKIVGPAYHDVAMKYAGDPKARSMIEASIRAGGAGKWGAVPMPPFPNLSTADLESLADYVLEQ